MPLEWRKSIYALFCCVLFDISSPALVAQDLSGWQADSAVTAVQLESVTEVPGSVIFNLKNVSQKPLTAIVVIAPDAGWSISNYNGRGELMPGAIESMRVASGQFPRGVRILKIAAVVFAAGTAEGSPLQIGFVMGQKLGDALETTRLNAILARLPVDHALADAELDVFVEKVGRTLPASLREVVESLKGVSVRGVSVDDIPATRTEVGNGLLSGARIARGEVLQDVEDLRQLPPSMSTAAGSRRESLADLKRRHQELQTKQETQLKGINVEDLK